jgi:hypothetical protein
MIRRTKRPRSPLGTRNQIESVLVFRSGPLLNHGTKHEDSASYPKDGIRDVSREFHSGRLPSPQGHG